MHNLAGAGDMLATLSKHRIAGIIAFALGAILILFGGFRAFTKVATAPLVPLLGVGVIVLGVLVFTRTL